MLMTAAGTIRPSAVVVMGAGVAGLQAIATAHRLGAVVEVSDIRRRSRSRSSRWARKFMELPRRRARGQGGYAQEITREHQAPQREIVGRAHRQDRRGDHHRGRSPGDARPSWSPKMVGRMRPGSMIVDLAVETGGNCELSRAGKTVEVDNDVMHRPGPANLPADHGRARRQPPYARNIQSLLGLMIDEGELKLDFDDEVIAGACITRGGEIVNEGAKAAAGAATA